MREIRLFDSTTGELSPVKQGDAIRIEVQRSHAVHEDGVVDVVSSRSFVLFGLLQRFLDWEGFPTTFLFDSPNGDDFLYQLSEDLIDHSGSIANGELSLLEVQRDDVERWIDIRFGAGRAEAQSIATHASERISLSIALERYGPHAVTLYLLGTHYSQPLGGAVEGLVVGAHHVQRIRALLGTLRPGEPSPADMHEHVEAFRDALASDLNTPLALVVLFEWLLEAERRGGDLGDEDLRMMLEMFELHDLALPVGAT